MPTLTVPKDCLVGQKLDVEGNDFAPDADYAMRCVSRQAEMDILVKGKIDLAGKFVNIDVVAPAEGVLHWTVTDGTNTIVAQTRVFRG